MELKIKSALISVFYKDGLAPLAKELAKQDVKIYSTGGTQKFIEDLGIDVIPVEQLTSYPSILGGRVKTLHPLVFGGILGRRAEENDLKEMAEFGIPEIDLVIVDLYPFQETLAQTKDEKQIIEKIDIGGPSMLRAAAKNFSHVTVLSSKDDYSKLISILQSQDGKTNLEQRKSFAAKAFAVVKEYDIAISDYFNPAMEGRQQKETFLRYGENPHQKASFTGDLDACFAQLHGKEISYNNLVDIEAAIDIIHEFSETTFAIIKHTNVCGIASRDTVAHAWKVALSSDPESAFGGVLVCNGEVDEETASAISEIFFEVLIAPSYSEAALNILKGKKNRILLQMKKTELPGSMFKSVLNGTLRQDKDVENFREWKVVAADVDENKKQDLVFANLVCKHLKSNAIALVKNKQLVGKGCGQTSRIDALRQALDKAKQFGVNLQDAVMASDAFFPFDDCVKMGHEAGISAFIQPGGSIRDKDSIDYCVANKLAMVLTGMRHFRH